MPYYHTCTLCGANLDPGERCDCEKEEPSDAPPSKGPATQEKSQLQSTPNDDK